VRLCVVFAVLAGGYRVRVPHPKMHMTSLQPAFPRALGIVVGVALGLASPRSVAADATPAPAAPAATARGGAAARMLEYRGSLLIIGNSFQFADGSAVRFYRANTVTDLNQGGVGGVAALVKAFANQAGLDYAVSIEAISGAALDRHLETKKDLLARPWEHVVMAGYSTLDQNSPGNPALLVRTAREMAGLLAAQNPKVDIRLIATWPRADQTYPDSGHWHGKPIDAMALEVRAGYDLAAAGTPLIRGVIPVGEAWLRAMKAGIADPNPYDGVAFGQIDLWTHDHYHASNFGYYLEALMIFGDLTGLDPASLGQNERVALELGFSRAQTAALQKVASEELAARQDRAPLQTFAPVPLR
jgi:hypothetical protein